MSDLLNNIKNLREMTGAGFLDCKKSLEESGNDLDNAVDFLRKKGLAKANKKSSREAKEGAIGIFSNSNITSILQINTETDFAAKNEIFLNFMDEIGNYSLENNDINLSIDEFNKISYNGITIGDHFKNIIAKIGENIILTKLIKIKKTENEFLSSYIHNSYRKNVGKIGVILKFKAQDINENVNKLGKNMCMHIAASKPLSLNIDQLDKKLIEKETEVQLESIKSSGKPENIIEKYA